jgi:hypothetical protein
MHSFKTALFFGFPRTFCEDEHQAKIANFAIVISSASLSWWGIKQIHYILINI